MVKLTETLCIVIVLYKIQLEESVSFQSILNAHRGEEVISIFVYDNSPFPQKLKEYSGLNMTYEHNPNNPGVSKAYNTGAQYALQNRKNWILLLDQDTTLPNEILSKFNTAINQHPLIKLFAPKLILENGRIFSPCRYFFKRGFHLNEITAGIHSFEKLAPVNSGMLINLSTFFISGGYNNSVKLDFSDFQFVERFRKIEPNFCVIDVECQQDFSDNQVSVSNQITRFRFYCEGALEITKDGLLDWLQYYIIVFARACKLTMRHKKMDFLHIYLNYFVYNSFSITD